MQLLRLLLVSSILLSMGCVSITTQQPSLSYEAVASEMQTQQEAALAHYLEQSIQVATVMFRLSRASVPLCHDDVAYGYGIVLMNQQSLPPSYRDTAHVTRNMDKTLQIMAVLPDSPAQDAKLQINDKMIYIDEQLAPVGKQARAGIAKMLKKQSEHAVVVLRDKHLHDVMIKATAICDYDVFLDHQDTPNAYSDGTRIVLSRGMLNFIENDEQLAFVLAHEMAHNILEHSKTAVYNKTLGAFFDLLITASGKETAGGMTEIGKHRSKAFEHEADYVGLYLVARAGYDIAKAAEFWRRIAIYFPQGISKQLLASHPTTPERFVAMQATIKEIQSKQQAGVPLIPNTKD